MVLRTVILPTATYTAPSQYCPSTVLSNLTLSCPYQDQEADASLEISDFAEVLPKFESAEQDWNSFGYLLNEQPGTSSDKTTTPIKKITVFQKPVEPIGKGPRRRRRCADREISELGKFLEKFALLDDSKRRKILDNLEKIFRQILFQLFRICGDHCLLNISRRLLCVFSLLYAFFW